MKTCVKVNCPDTEGKTCKTCGCKVPPEDFTEEMSLNEKRKRQREIDEFERYNATDSFGNCFSDADPGL